MQIDINLRSFEELQKKMKAEGEQRKLAQQQAQLTAQKKLEKEAEGIKNKYQISKEETDIIGGYKKTMEGQDLMSLRIAEQQKAKADRDMMAAAYARGYDPTAIRASQKGVALAQGQIAGQASIAAKQERDQAAADYQAALDYKQRMAMAGEEAKKAYLMGNKELAQKQEESLLNYQAGLREIESRRKAANAQRESAIIGGLLSAGATVAATVATGNPMAGLAAGSATSALYQGTQR